MCLLHARFRDEISGSKVGTSALQDIAKWISKGAASIHIATGSKDVKYQRLQR
jgi:hypothetical protein